MTNTMSSSWMSALRKALVISTLDHVVSAEHARLSINRKRQEWSIEISGSRRVLSP